MRRTTYRVQVTCVAAVLVVVAACARKVSFPVPGATAARLNETVDTPDGSCRLWMPTSSGGPLEFSYARCALDRVPVLRPGSRMPPPPLVELTAHGGFAVVVDENGRVNQQLTHAVIGTTDTIFGRQALEAIRQWRFEPATRAGARVRTTFRLHLVSGPRVDTLPSRLDWTYRQGRVADTLHGVWVPDEKPEPYHSRERDRIYIALVRRLLATRTVVPSPAIRYCLSLPDADASDAARLGRELGRLDAFARTRDDVAPCVDGDGSRRIILPRIHRTERDRAVVLPAGDVLPFFPRTLDGTSWERWQGRCVMARVSRSLWTHCEVGSDATMDQQRAFYQGLRVVAPATLPRPDSVPVAMTVAIMTGGAWQVDTMRVVVPRVPRLSDRSFTDAASTCDGWRIHTAEPSAPVYVIRGALMARGSLTVARADNRPVPNPSGVAACRPMAPQSTFLLGGVGDPTTQPLTLCTNDCSQRHTIDPGRHTAADGPAIRFRFSDLSEATLAGSHLMMRIRAEPDDSNLQPLVVVDRGGGRYSAWSLQRDARGFWEHRVIMQYPPGAEILVYLLAR